MVKAPLSRLLFVAIAIVWVVIVARAYLNVKGTDALQPSVPQPQVEAFARAQLDALQQPSFEGNIELCGIIFESAEGELGVSRQVSGETATCDIAFFDEPGMVPVASFHTHGRHSPLYDAEVPSLTDITSDMATGVDGYVATPGGRFWHIDHRTGIARLVCGPGCLVQDPRYVPCDGDLIAERYTMDQLAERFGGAAPDC
jgi:hypothetical protein